MLAWVGVRARKIPTNQQGCLVYQGGTDGKLQFGVHHKHTINMVSAFEI